MKIIDCSGTEKRINCQEMPLVSVIIPVYNSESYLKECLDSVLNQTYRNIEVICVDDGSVDHSLEILKYYENKDSRMKVYTQANKGPSAARNKALDNANGEYISFVDSDDFLQLNTYEILIECALQQQSWDLIIFGGNIIGANDKYFADKLTTEFKQYINCAPGNVVFNEKAARPFLWLHFIKRELLERPHKIRFEESINLGEDQIFQFEYVPRAKNVMVIDQKLYNYRMDNNASLMQLYNNRKIKKTECHFEIIEKVIENWKKDGRYSIYQDDIWTWAVQLIYWTINELPIEFRREYSNKLLELMEQNCVREYLLASCEKAHYKELIEWSRSEMSAEDEVLQLKTQLEREKYEINETTKSRAFKLGRIFTLKSKQLDVQEILRDL